MLRLDLRRGVLRRLGLAPHGAPSTLSTLASPRQALLAPSACLVRGAHHDAARNSPSLALRRFDVRPRRSVHRVAQSAAAMLHNRSPEDNLKALQDEATRLLQLESDLALRDARTHAR